MAIEKLGLTPKSFFTKIIFDTTQAKSRKIALLAKIVFCGLTLGLGYMGCYLYQRLSQKKSEELTALDKSTEQLFEKTLGTPEKLPPKPEALSKTPPLENPPIVIKEETPPQVPEKVEEETPPIVIKEETLPQVPEKVEVETPPIVIKEEENTKDVEIPLPPLFTKERVYYESTLPNKLDSEESHIVIRVDSPDAVKKCLEELKIIIENEKTSPFPRFQHAFFISEARLYLSDYREIPRLKKLKDSVVLVYRFGQSGWHKDDEKILKPNCEIFSFSFYTLERLYLKEDVVWRAVYNKKTGMRVSNEIAKRST